MAVAMRDRWQREAIRVYCEAVNRLENEARLQDALADADSLDYARKAHRKEAEHLRFVAEYARRAARAEAWPGKCKT